MNEVCDHLEMKELRRENTFFLEMDILELGLSVLNFSFLAEKWSHR